MLIYQVLFFSTQKRYIRNIIFWFGDHKQTFVNMYTFSIFIPIIYISFQENIFTYMLLIDIFVGQWQYGIEN